jgi:hypothetical protein
MRAIATTSADNDSIRNTVGCSHTGRRRAREGTGRQTYFLRRPEDPIRVAFDQYG